MKKEHYSATPRKIRKGDRRPLELLRFYDRKYGSEESSIIRHNERIRSGGFQILRKLFKKYNLNSEGRILDVGVNDGQEMHSLGVSSFHGVDISLRSLKRCKSKPGLKTSLCSI